MKHTPAPFTHPSRRSARARIAVIGAAALTALAGTVMATPLPPPPTPTPAPVKPKAPVVDTRPQRFQDSVDAVLDNHAAHQPANLIQGSATTRIVDRLRELGRLGVTAGAGGGKASKEIVPPPSSLNASMYGEYSYVTSNDRRQVDTDSITNSGTGGFDITLGKTLLGLIYSYSHQSMASDFLKSNTSSDSNFVSLYAAQPITPYLSVGLTGGYGHTDVLVRLRQAGGQRALQRSSDTDTWTASPFFSLAYANNNFYASFTTTYQYLHTDTDDTGQLNFQLAAGYQIAEWLGAEVSGKATQMLHSTRRGIPEDDNCFGFGAKLKQNVTPKFAVYEGYEFNFNDDFREHTITGGLTYSF
jgi:opacity protein-like surface antigen